MTVTQTVPSVRYEYTAPGQYDFNFRAFRDEDIRVWHANAEGVVYELLFNIDYTVTVYDDIEGGYITIQPTAPLPAGEGFVLIRRILDIDQQVDWVNNDPFDMEVHETSMDKVTMILQQQEVIVREGSSQLRWRGYWQPAIYYLMGQMVAVQQKGENIYACAEDHVAAADFEVDLDAGYWLLVFDMEYLSELVAQAEAARDAAQAAQAAAEAAQAAAEAAQAAAEAARDESLGWSTRSSEWAENPYNSEIPDNPGSFSSLHWSTRSGQFADYPYDTVIPANPGRFSALHWSERSNQFSNHPYDTEVPDNPGLYSALHWSQRSSEWSDTAHNTPVPGNPGRFSSMHWATEAENSAGDADGSAGDAADSALLASQWAQNPYGTPVIPDEFSSLHWATQSSYWATQAYDEDVPGFPGGRSSFHWSVRSGQFADTDKDTEVPGNPGRYSALHWSEISSDWANTDYDVELRPGEYSAYHWTIRAGQWADFYVNGDPDDSANWVPENDGRYSARWWALYAMDIVSGIQVPPASEGDIGDILVVAENPDPPYGQHYEHRGIDLSVVGNLHSDGRNPMESDYVPVGDFDLVYKSYTDGYSDTGDAATLAAANSYTDTEVANGDAATLAAANAYTDAEVTAGDAATLAAANSYTDTQIGAIDTGVMSVTAGENITVGGTPENPSVAVNRTAQHPFFAASGVSGAQDSNINLAPVQHLTLDAATTMNFVGAIAGRAHTITIRFINPSNFTLDFAQTIQWPLDVDAPANTEWGGTWEVSLYTVDSGTTWIATNRVQYA